MTDVVRDAIAEELAELARVAPTPSAPFGFGVDISCTTDLVETMPEVDPLSMRALGEALVRRLDCPRGALPGDPDYGYDLRGTLNRGVTAQHVRAIAADVRGEVTKDDRVSSATVTVTPAPTGSSLRVQIVVTPIDPRVGVFTLTLAVTSAEVLLEELRGR